MLPSEDSISQVDVSLLTDFEVLWVPGLQTVYTWHPLWLGSAKFHSLRNTCHSLHWIILHLVVCFLVLIYYSHYEDGVDINVYLQGSLSHHRMFLRTCSIMICTWTVFDIYWFGSVDVMCTRCICIQKLSVSKGVMLCIYANYKNTCLSNLGRSLLEVMYTAMK